MAQTSAILNKVTIDNSITLNRVLSVATVYYEIHWAVAWKLWTWSWLQFVTGLQYKPNNKLTCSLLTYQKW